MFSGVSGPHFFLCDAVIISARLEQVFISVWLDLIYLVAHYHYIGYRASSEKIYEHCE
jgi:hypothetical protein